MMPRTAVGRQRLLTLLLAIVLLVLLLPYVWLILTSLKSRNDIFSGDVFGGFAPTFENFRMAFIQKIHGGLNFLEDSYSIIKSDHIRRY